MTREEAIKLLVNATYSDEWQGNEDLTTAHNMAIQTLEQEPILDKIRAEISNIPLTDTDGNNGHWYREPQAIIDDVLQIIDKYKAESEDKE